MTNTTTATTTTTTATTTTTTGSAEGIEPDLASIKARQQVTWGSGDYSMIGVTLQLTGESLCEVVDIAAGQRVIDVAAGNGNASLAAARRGGRVVATDYVPALLEGTAARAGAERLPIETRVADAEALPFDDDSFDVVLSTFGVMFTPDQEKAASELVRVCRRGGRIGLATWTPTGFVGEMFKVVGRHVPPPVGVRSPLEWGREERLAELFPGQSVKATTQQFVFRYRTALEWVETFRTFYGPMFKAFAALDEQGRTELESELVALAEARNTATDAALRVPGDYLEVVIRKA